MPTTTNQSTWSNSSTSSTLPIINPILDSSVLTPRIIGNNSPAPSSSNSSLSPTLSINNDSLSPVSVAEVPTVYRNIPSATVTQTYTGAVKKQPPLPSKVIKNREFTGMGLYYDIPTIFIKNELYRFQGVVTDISSVFLNTPGVSFNYVNVIFSKIESN